MLSMQDGAAKCYNFILLIFDTKVIQTVRGLSFSMREDLGNDNRKSVAWGWVVTTILILVHVTTDLP